MQLGGGGVVSFVAAGEIMGGMLTADQNHSVWPNSWWRDGNVIVRHKIETMSLFSSYLR